MRKIIILPILIGLFALTGCTANNGSYEECLKSCCVNEGQYREYSDGHCTIIGNDVGFDKNCSNICVQKYR